MARITDDSVVLVLDGSDLSKLRSIDFCAHPLDVVEDLEAIPYAEAPTGAVDSTCSGAADLVGGSYLLPHRVECNRVVFRVVAFAAPAEGVLLLYQQPEGRSASLLARVATCPFTPVANTTFEIAPSEGTIFLASGLLFALWGKVSGAGSFGLVTYNTSTTKLLNNYSPVGTHPAVADSALSAAAPPATIDPLIGGDLSAAGVNDVVPIIRLRNV